MRRSTRSLLFFSAVVVMLTIPAEILLLRAVAVPDQEEAIRQWAMELGEEELSFEVSRIQAYPQRYRRELLRAASPSIRAATWSAHLDAYLQSHPSLDVNTVSLIQALGSMLTPQSFAAVTPELREQVKSLGDQVTVLLGTEEAGRLLVWLGPRDGTFAGFEPTAMYLTNKLRGLFVAGAQGGECDCREEWGCYDYGMSCQGVGQCTPVDGYPYCGFLWMEACDGVCASGW